MKIDQIGNYPSVSSRESQILARGHARPGGSSLQQEVRQPGEAFVIFFVFLLTHSPVQRRSTDMAVDLQISEIPYEETAVGGNAPPPLQ